MKTRGKKDCGVGKENRRPERGKRGDLQGSIEQGQRALGNIDRKNILMSRNEREPINNYSAILGSTYGSLAL